MRAGMLPEAEKRTGRGSELRELREGHLDNLTTAAQVGERWAEEPEQQRRKKGRGQWCRLTA